MSHLSRHAAAPDSRALRAAANRRHAALRAALNLVLGPRLRLAREALGISEQEAVTIFRCTPRTFRKIEAGHSSPHVCALNDFCEKYNVSWVWLAGGDVPEDCAGLAPAQAIRRMAGLVAH